MSVYNKPVSQIRSSDLQELLDEEAVENIRLEFKREVPSKEEVLKKLSSFANTCGGYLIVGVAADSADGRILSLPGIEQVKGFKQQTVQWCYDGVSPPIQPFVSDPIAAAADSSKYCYVVFVEESDEAPHFINSRRGVYVRTDEFSQRFEPRLATFQEIQHLANRRQLAVARRTELFRRAENRFEVFAEKDYNSSPATTGQIGATFKLAVCPRFPVGTLLEQSELMEMLPKIQVRWRRNLFPYCGSFLSQHESAIGLQTGSGFSMLEANVWGHLYYATEIEEVNEAQLVIHLHLLLGHLLVYLEHARLFYEKVGFNGTLDFVVRLEHVLRVPLFSRRVGFRQTPPASRFDDVVEFEAHFTSAILQSARDTIATQLIRTILFALNWPGAAMEEPTAQMFLGDAYEFNGWHHTPR